MSPHTPQPPTCAPRSTLCAMGATGGDVGPGVTLSPLGCPQPHPVVPKASHCPQGPPHTPQPPTCTPQSTPCVMGAQWVPLVVMWGPNHHPLSTPSPPVPPIPLCLSPWRPIVPKASHCPHMGVPRAPHVPTMSPPLQPPTCAPQSALCAMGAAGGDYVGPCVTLSPLGLSPTPPHCPHGVPLSPYGCPQGVPLSPR